MAGGRLEMILAILINNETIVAADQGGGFRLRPVGLQNEVPAGDQGPVDP